MVRSTRFIRRPAAILGLVVAASVAVVAAGSTAAHATTLTISGTMEGNLPINPGDTLKAGYDFTIPGGPKNADTVTVSSASVVINAQCKDGTQSPLTISLPTQTYTVPAKDGGDWFPSGDQQSALVYQGSIVVPSSFCGGQQGHAPKGAVFSADFAATENTGLNVRMHYADNTSGSWSGTAHVTPTPPQPNQGSITICKVAGDDATLGQTFTFTVGNKTVTVVAGNGPVGNCKNAGLFPDGSVTITEQKFYPDTGATYAVSSIVVSPADHLVSSDKKSATVTVTVSSDPTTVTYTNTRSS